MITGIGHPGLVVKDIEESVKFYTEVMGLKEAFRMIEPDGSVGAIYLYIAPSQFIEIFPRPETAQDPDVPPYKAGKAHICYEISDAEATIAAMRAKGAVIDIDLKKGKSKTNLFFTHDPDGNRIELMELTPESLQWQANEKFANQK